MRQNVQIDPAVAADSAGQPANSKQEDLVIRNVNVQYVGFESKALARDYRFVVRQALNESTEYVITIGNEVFAPRRVRFQDAPEICSLKLHRELAAFNDHPPHVHYRVSEIDLDEFIISQKRTTRTRPAKPTVPRT